MTEVGTQLFAALIGLRSLELGGGKIAFFHDSRMTVHGDDNTTEIFGIMGKLSISLIPRQDSVELCDISSYIKTEPTPSWYDRYEKAYVTELVSWVDALLDGKPMPITLRSSVIGSLVITDALQQSLRTCRRITYNRGGIRKTPGAHF